MMKTDDAKTTVQDFYNGVGWQRDEVGISHDARLNEDLRPVAAEYVSRCRKRLLRYLPEEGRHLLDMASGPVQYREYLEYSRNFQKHHCVDLSSLALSQAREKLSSKGEYYCGDFLELSLPENYFDASISCHTIYHIYKDHQELAVRKLLRLTKPGQPVVIVYSNPHHCMARVAAVIKRFLEKGKLANTSGDVYFHAHPLAFWEKFKSDASVELFPWRSFSSKHQKVLFPNHIVGKLMFKMLFGLEEWFPSFFIRYFKFYTVVLRRHS